MAGLKLAGANCAHRYYPVLSRWNRCRQASVDGIWWVRRPRFSRPGDPIKNRRT